MKTAIQKEGEKARRWRERRGLSRPALGDLVGYSPEAIQAFESGAFSNGRAVSPTSMQTFKLACAAVASNLSFDWEDVTIRI